jgi:hypothetical protein
MLREKAQVVKPLPVAHVREGLNRFRDGRVGGLRGVQGFVELALKLGHARQDRSTS